MLVETIDDLVTVDRSDTALPLCIQVESDDFAAVVHACNEQIVLAGWRGVPFHAPGAASDVHLSQRNKRFARVEQADSVIVTISACSEKEATMA